MKSSNDIPIFGVDSRGRDIIYFYTVEAGKRCGCPCFTVARRFLEEFCVVWTGVLTNLKDAYSTLWSEGDCAYAVRSDLDGVDRHVLSPRL